MNQTVVQIPLTGLIIALAVTVLLVGYLLYRVAASEKAGKKNPSVNVPMPFSAPRPGPDPIPPARAAAMPVVPLADPNIRPTRFAYDQTYFERCYAPCKGSVVSIQVKVNDRVQKGDILMGLKLDQVESDLRASASGKIRELNCKAGTAFNRDDLLYVIQ